jgi:hypothetical protein
LGVQIDPESKMPNERFVAVGLLTRRDLDVLGSGFRRAFPLDNKTDFSALLVEIDRAERQARDEVPTAASDWRR